MPPSGREAARPLCATCVLKSNSRDAVLLYAFLFAYVSPRYARRRRRRQLSLQFLDQHQICKAPDKTFQLKPVRPSGLFGADLSRFQLSSSDTRVCVCVFFFHINPSVYCQCSVVPKSPLPSRMVLLSVTLPHHKCLGSRTAQPLMLSPIELFREWT